MEKKSEKPGMQLRRFAFFFALFSTFFYFGNAHAETETITKLHDGYQYRIVLSPDKTNDVIFVRYKNDGTWSQVASGPVESFALGADDRREINDPAFLGRRVYAKLPPVADFLWVKMGETMTLLTKGLAIPLNEYAQGMATRISDVVTYKDESFIALSEDGPQPATVLIRLRDKKTIKISSTFSDKLKTLDISKTGILAIPGMPRQIDLEAYEMEATFKPIASEAVKNSKGEFVDAVDTVTKEFRDIRYKAQKVPSLVVDSDKENMRKLRSAFTSEEGPKAAVILGDEGTGRNTLALNFIKILPRTWRVFAVEASVSSGTSYAGQFSERMKTLVVASRQIPIVWFLRNMHKLSGKGAHANDPNADFYEFVEEPFKDGEMMALGTDNSSDFYDTFSGKENLLDSLTQIKRKPLTAEEKDAIVQNWLRFQGYASPSAQVEARAKLLSKAFKPTQEDPIRLIKLYTVVYRLMKDDGLQNQSPTIAYVEEAAKQYYDLEVSSIDRGAQRARLKNLGKVLDDRIIGQTLLKTTLKYLTERKFSGLHEGKGPAVSIMAVGLPGLGKTEGALAYADAMNLPFIRLEMNRYKTKESALKLMTLIADRLRKNPQTVIILDEIEKAHEDVMDSLLAMMDSGIFSATVYKDASKKETVEVNESAQMATVYMTTNAADGWLEEWKKNNPDRDHLTFEELVELKREMVHLGFSRPLLDRIPEVVPVLPPTKPEFTALIRMHVMNKIKFLNKNVLKTSWPSAEKFIEGMANQYYSNLVGNREVLRLIVKNVDGKIAPSLVYNETLDDPEIAHKKIIKIETHEEPGGGVSCRVELEDVSSNEGSHGH